MGGCGPWTALTARRAHPRVVVEVLVLGAVVATWGWCQERLGLSAGAGGPSPSGLGSCPLCRSCPSLCPELQRLLPLVPYPQPPCTGPLTPHILPVAAPWLQALPSTTCRALAFMPVSTWPREPSVPWANLSLSVPRTFDVGPREALQVVGAEARLVVPRAVGLLGVLEPAGACPCVRVVEVAVDGWGTDAHRRP